MNASHVQGWAGSLKRMQTRRCATRGPALVLSLVFWLSQCVPACAREVIDMAGRKVTLPDHIERAWGSAPPLSVLLAMVAPQTLVGWNLVLPPHAERYLPPGLADKPVLGGVYGMGRAADAEEVLAARPQVVLAWKSPLVDPVMVETFFAKLKIPVVFVTLDTLADWPAALRFTADVLGTSKAEAAAQASDVQQAMDKVKAAVGGLPEGDKVRVYYAEGPAGLNTDCHTSFHTEAIELAGGWNIHRCQPRTHMGMEAISLEEVIAADPQVIIAQDPAFAVAVVKDPRWQGISAVRQHRVHVVPRLPMNWIDRPPSAMRALGIQWLAQRFYPQRYPIDLPAEAARFYQRFLHVRLSTADLQTLLAQP